MNKLLTALAKLTSFCSSGPRQGSRASSACAMQRVLSGFYATHTVWRVCTFSSACWGLLMVTSKSTAA